jgi:IclR family transcriptional regulator, KDG regulon repressor
MPIIQSVDRALQILDLFDEHQPELKITEISKQMNLNKSTVHSLLKTLVSHGYAEQDKESGKYRLGLKLFERGNFVSHNLDIRAIARRYLIDLSAKTGHTLNLVILDGKEGVYVDKVEGRSAAILYSRIGRRVPVHSSSVGKALVAFKSNEELMEILKDYHYKKQTPHTILTEEAFLTCLTEVRERGYAIESQENEPGIACVAIPIRNHTGAVIAAVSMSMPAPRLETGEMDEIIENLKGIGHKISKDMGYQYRSPLARMS